jgi:hypothetical protein
MNIAILFYDLFRIPKDAYIAIACAPAPQAPGRAWRCAHPGDEPVQDNRRWLRHHFVNAVEMADDHAIARLIVRLMAPFSAGAHSRRTFRLKRRRCRRWKGRNTTTGMSRRAGLALLGLELRRFGRCINSPRTSQRCNGSTIGGSVCLLGGNINLVAEAPLREHGEPILGVNAAYAARAPVRPEPVSVPRRPVNGSFPSCKGGLFLYPPV